MLTQILLLMMNYPKFGPDFQMLASTASYIQKDLEEISDLWKNSPFEWVIQLPPRSKGALARNLISSWCASKGLPIERDKNSGDMLILNGVQYAVKFSMLWKTGIYKFQQIKINGPEYIICFGISPYEAHCWIIDKDAALNHGQPQHVGASGAEYWLSIYPTEIPDWAKKYGGTMENAYKILKSKKSHKS